MSSVASDFYDFIIVDEKHLGMLIADVSGHGLPAALIASMLKVALAAQSPHAFDPARVLAGLNLCLANCYFAHDSSGFPTLLLFFDAQSGRSCYPLDRNAGPVARTWWRPFPGRGVASPETPAPDRESLPATIAQSIRGGPHPCRLAGAPGASNSSSPFPCGQKTRRGP